MGNGIEKSPSRIGFFGGSFDPMHIGHVSLAKQAIQSCALDLLLLCPAYHAPLRAEKPLFSSETRLKILEGVAQENQKIDICRLEIEKQKTCFTFDTLNEIRSQYPKSEIKILLGADQFERLNEWKFHRQLAQAHSFLVFSRYHNHPSPPPIPNLSYKLLHNPLIECSSTEIRNRIKSGQSVRELLPPSAYPFVER